MKIRQGFVSNSSSSSFVALGVYLDKEVIESLAKKTVDEYLANNTELDKWKKEIVEEYLQGKRPARFLMMELELESNLTEIDAEWHDGLFGVHLGGEVKYTFAELESKIDNLVKTFEEIGISVRPKDVLLVSGEKNC